MSIFIKSKPRAAATFQPPDSNKIFLHHGENSEGFNRITKYENFLTEIMKFFPAFMQEGCQTGEETTLQEDGIGTWAEDWNTACPTDTKNYWTRGYCVRGVLEGNYGSRYGDFHMVELDDKYWGYGAAKGAKNLNLNPSASEWSHFKDTDPETGNPYPDIDPEGAENPLDVSAYSSLLYQPGTAPSLGSISGSLWSSVQSYLNNPNFQGKSYYEIAMTGVANSVISSTGGGWNPQWDLNGDGVLETYHSIGQGVGDNYTVTHNGGFLYDGTEGSDGSGAFYLMTAMLESRRRINSAMSWLYGSPYMINDNLAMLDYIRSVYNDTDKLGNVNAQNKRVLESFFGLQHALRAVLPCYSGGVTVSNGTASALTLADDSSGINSFGSADSGYAGYVYSARDIVGFQRFRHWIINNAGHYITDHLGGDDQTNASALLNEFRFLYDQPYGADQQNAASGSLTPNSAYIGWDRFHSGWWNGGNTVVDNMPYGTSPLAPSMGGNHPNYAVSQVLGLSDDQRVGAKSVSGEGPNPVVGDMYNYNWVVHVTGDFYKWRKDVIGQNMRALAMNNMERRRYKKDMKEYREWKVDKKNEEYEDKHEEAIYERKRAENRRLQKTKNKGQVNNQKKASSQNAHKPAEKNNGAKEMQKAQEKMRVAMLKKIIGEGKERANKSKEARKS